MRHDLPDAPVHEVSPSTSLWVSGPGAKETPEDALARYLEAYPERQACLSPDGKSMRIVLAPKPWPATITINGVDVPGIVGVDMGDLAR